MSHGMRWWVQLFILLAMSDAGNQPVELGEKGGGFAKLTPLSDSTLLVESEGFNPVNLHFAKPWLTPIA